MLIGELFGLRHAHCSNCVTQAVLKSISSAGKSMLIELQKVGGYYYSGQIHFIASIKYNKINPDCKSWLENNVLKSPKHANINCSWIITSEFGSYITLDFNFIEVKSAMIIMQLLGPHLDNFLLQFLKIA